MREAVNNAAKVLAKNPEVCQRCAADGESVFVILVICWFVGLVDDL